MERLEEYAEHARECREAGGKARTADLRELYLRMAERWEDLARQRATHLHLEDVLTEILNSKDGASPS